MNLAYIIALIINHNNHITSIRTKKPQHKIYVVHPSVGLCPSTLLFFIVFFQYSTSIEPQEPTPHRIGDLCAPH